MLSGMFMDDLLDDAGDVFDDLSFQVGGQLVPDSGI
jgi:hypothetical protein